MSRSTPAFAYRLAQSANDREYNAALFTAQHLMRPQSAGVQQRASSFKAPTVQKPKEALWVRIKNRLLDIWQKVKEYVND
ncbi:hypothetical protein HX794_02550 [Pseudomonas costantinii]|uniref:hypothetical protein n=1 Tax=Pseudomonas costantinii TaxID=168469 RepID=UPI0015A1C9D3|nr:hypothetical protein [Pseudomonas costantinii]NVZ18516.1 hypothetical protein [Pseudomonas costantinii]